jgi:O-antigen ligase
VAKLVAAACAMLAISVGVLTKTDALTLAFAIAGLIIIVLTFRSWLHASEREVTVRFAFVWIMVLILPLALIAAAPLGYAIGTDLKGFSKKLTRENSEQTKDKTSLRFFLWQQAIARGLESGSLGLGPGPHLEIPTSIIAGRESEHEPVNLEHPAVNGTPNFEAHNTFLDLFAQGGLIATLSFIWLAATTLTITYRANLVALTALFGGLVVLSAFHLIIRLPLFWFAAALCLVVGTNTRNPRLRI